MLSELFGGIKLHLCQYRFIFVEHIQRVNVWSIQSSVCICACNTVHLFPCSHHSLLKSSPGSYTRLKLHASNEMSKRLRVCACCCVSREFGRWKVNSLAAEKRDGVGGTGGLALPLDPDFMHTIRLLGRRPTLLSITENLIKKYGTHLLVSATLGGTVEYASFNESPDSRSFKCDLVVFFQHMLISPSIGFYKQSILEFYWICVFFSFFLAHKKTSNLCGYNKLFEVGGERQI